MNKKLKLLYSTLIGLLAGPLFFITAAILDQAGARFDVWLPISISLAVILIIFFHTIRKIEKKMIVIATVLLVLSSTYSVCFVYDLLLIGPGPKQLTYMHLLAKLRDEKGRIDPNWVGSEWNFYKPKCYSEFCVERYGNTSLEVAVFYYGRISHNPVNSELKCLYTSLFCGITDSKTAYETYKGLLSESGFLVEEGLDYFTAKNETIIAYCQLDREFIVVVKADRDEKYLLNQTKIWS